MTPKCTSWMGHKFEARYSKKLPAHGFKADVIYIPMIEAIKDTIYEREVCVRCGHVIERKDG